MRAFLAAAFAAALLAAPAIAGDVAMVTQATGVLCDTDAQVESVVRAYDKTPNLNSALEKFACGLERVAYSRDIKVREIKHDGPMVEIWSVTIYGKITSQGFVPVIPPAKKYSVFLIPGEDL